MIRRILMSMIIMKTPIVLTLGIRRRITIIQLIKEVVDILIVIKLAMVLVVVVVTIAVTVPMATTVLTELVGGVLLASIPVLGRQALVPCLFAVVAVGRRLVFRTLPPLHRVLDVVVDPVLADLLLFLFWSQRLQRPYLVPRHEDGTYGLLQHEKAALLVMVSMAAVLTMMVAVTLAMALMMAFLMPVAMTVLVSVAMLVLVPVKLVVALLMAVMMATVMTAVMSVVMTSLLAMMMAVVVNMMIAIPSLSNMRKSLGVTTIMAMILITTVDTVSVFMTMPMTVMTVTVTVMSMSMSMALNTVLPATLTIMLNLPSPFLGFGWVVLEIFTRDQRCRDEPVKGLLDTISSSTVLGTLLAHDDLERFLRFDATSKIQNESLPDDSVQTLLGFHFVLLTRSAARKLLIAVRMGRSTSPSRYLPDSWVTFRRRITD